MRWKTDAGSTGRLLQLCAAYFVCYVLTGIFAKVFTGGYPLHESEMGYLVSSTLGGSAVALSVVFAAGWYRFKSNRLVTWGPLTVPSEVAYIIPSGVCTAIVIPGTTLMYTLHGVSVMVAMVVMRGSIIVVSRLVDTIQIRQGILKKRVYAEENWAVVFALLAVAVSLLLLPLVGVLEAWGVHASHWLGIKPAAPGTGFDLFHVVVLCLYLSAYMVRIYLMNYYKNTRGTGVTQDNHGFFAVEQFSACVTMILMVVGFYFAAPALGLRGVMLDEFRDGVEHLDWRGVLAGVPFGVAAFFSVFIFMFKGRTATFAGLVNRLTSLLAGTAATLFMFVVFSSRFPSAQDWLSVLFILVAVYFLTRAERLRTAELRAGGG